MSVSETASGAASGSAWVPRGVLSDRRLALLAGRGDQRAFEAIFERYHQELYRYCRGILADPDEAQDALQSTMVSALRSLPRDQRQIALRPWLYRVAHNVAISILRRRASTVNSGQLPDSPAPGADSEAETRERLRILVADLDHLPERQRGALVMRELNGLSYSEIGPALDTSEAAARQAVYEAREALREFNEGREMECDEARRALSHRDGRVLRGRRLRAHLRTCDSCQDFRVGISQRGADLRTLCPPLPGLAASGLLTSLLGELGTGGAGAGALAGGGTVGAAGAAGTSLATSATVKGASIAAAVVISTGAAGISGAVHLPLTGGHGGGVGNVDQPAVGGTGRHVKSSTGSHGGSPGARAPIKPQRASHRGGAAGHDRSPAEASGVPPGQAKPAGKSYGNPHGTPPGQYNQASQSHGNPHGTPPGQSNQVSQWYGNPHGTPPGQSNQASQSHGNPHGTPPGQAKPPGKSHLNPHGASPGLSKPVHESLGNPNTTPPGHSKPVHDSNGNPHGTSPGQVRPAHNSPGNAHLSPPPA